MAKMMPNQVIVTVTNMEVANELEALALAYEETVNKLRYEAERLRQGFTLTLDVRATQVHIPAPEYKLYDVDEEAIAERIREASLKTDPEVKTLPQEAIDLIDSMTKSEEEE